MFECTCWINDASQPKEVPSESELTVLSDTNSEETSVLTETESLEEEVDSAAVALDVDSAGGEWSQL